VQKGIVPYAVGGSAAAVVVAVIGHVVFQIGTLLVPPGPLWPTQWPSVLLGWLMAPGDVVRHAVPPLDSMLFVPPVDFWSWAFGGAVVGLVCWVVARAVLACTGWTGRLSRA